MWHKVDAYINRAISRVRLAFRAVIGDVSATGDVQFMDGTGLAGEQLEANELFQHYGFTSVPLAGSMAVVLPIGGRTAHGIVIATEHGSYRLKGLQSGEVAIYTDEGDSIVLNRGRVINLTTKTLNINAEEAVNITTKTVTIAASSAVNANTPQMTMSENLTVSGVASLNGGFSAQPGASGGDAGQIDGTVRVSDDVVAGGKSLVGHDHRDSQGGTTSPPL